MDVQALSDEELNRAMIWLNPPKDVRVTMFNDSIKGYWSHDLTPNFYNYLEDWSLTGPLMISNNIELTPYIYEEGEWRAYQIKKATNRHSTSTNPLRAICEVLVMIKQNATDIGSQSH